MRSWFWKSFTKIWKNLDRAHSGTVPGRRIFRGSNWVGTAMDRSAFSHSYRIRLALASAMFPSLLAGMANGANPIPVNTLDGGSGISGKCALADAVLAHNTKKAQGGCPTGSADDLIQFSVTGSIFVQNTLEVTGDTLTITGPGPTSNSIVIDSSQVETGEGGAMLVDTGATLTLDS
jgi:hypothetical protein